MPKTPQTIDALYAWVATEADGREGIVAVSVGDWMMPLVGADMDRMKSYRGYAEGIRTLTGREIRLVRFFGREDLEELP